MPREIVFLDESEWPEECFCFELTLDHATTGLCVIDMQNYCSQPEYDLARSMILTNSRVFEAFAGRVKRVTANTGELLRVFRAQGNRVIFTRNVVMLPDAADLVPRRRGRETFVLDATKGRSGHMPSRDSPGYQIVSCLTPAAGELILDKNTASAFNSTAIELFLRNLGLQTIVIAGLLSDACVLLTGFRRC